MAQRLTDGKTFRPQGLGHWAIGTRIEAAGGTEHGHDRSHVVGEIEDGH